MSNPPRGSKAISHELVSRKLVIQCNETKKKEEAEPDKTPIIKQIAIHLRKVLTENFSVNEFKLEVFRGIKV
jgi:hypothetical protein